MFTKRQTHMPLRFDRLAKQASIQLALRSCKTQLGATGWLLGRLLDMSGAAHLYEGVMLLLNVLPHNWWAGAVVKGFLLGHFFRRDLTCSCTVHQLSSCPPLTCWQCMFLRGADTGSTRGCGAHPNKVKVGALRDSQRGALSQTAVLLGAAAAAASESIQRNRRPTAIGTCNSGSRPQTLSCHGLLLKTHTSAGKY